MKKSLSILVLLSIALCTILVGCSQSETSTPPTAPDTNAAPATPPANQ